MPRFEGTFTAMVTPFTESGVDETRLREMVEFQISNGISGLVPCGTTGESPTLSHEEHHRVIDIVIETADINITSLSFDKRGDVEWHKSCSLIFYAIFLSREITLCLD